MKKSVLIITPFDSAGRRIFETIKRSLSEINFIPVSIEQSVKPGMIIGSSILELIQGSELIIVDITRKNPNVMYELGIAHALRKVTILIMEKESGSNIPSDLAGFLYLVYDKKNLTSLSENIKKQTLRITKEKK